MAATSPDYTDFEQAVAGVLEGLRPGDVIAYGEVAAEAGYPGRARAVGTFLSNHGDGFAWWRVVNASGRLAPGKEADQARRLRAEGVEVRGTRVVSSASPA
jgi:methylated-DNA-protein-cysteine methyltransferase-like protein